MYGASRSPYLRTVVAVLINVAFLALCHQYWSISDNKVHQKYYEHEEQFTFPQYSMDTKEESDPLQTPGKPKMLSSFEVPDELRLTHDVAVPRDIPTWTEADTASLDTAVGFDMMNELLKLEYNRVEDLQGDTGKARIDFALSSRAERIHKSLWNYLYPVYSALPGETAAEKERKFVKELSRERAEVDFFLRLESKLYPWLHLNRQTSFSMYDGFEGRGIVICAGNGQFEYLISSVQAIRRLQPKMPIQIFHMGPKDLSVERRKYITEMTNDIETVDIFEILDNEWMHLGGWSIKAFSILASRFKEVIMIDSDAYFLRDVAELFEDPGYKLTGTLYFYDRTLFPNWKKGPNWMRTFLPIMSSFPPTTRMFRGLSMHEQESGVVVVNKGTRLLGLLATCKMNSRWERSMYTYDNFYGDKESFWVGYEMVQEPYAFVKSYPGVIGEREEYPLKNDGSQPQTVAVCGTQLHLDYLERPMWWNAGLMRNKNSRDRRILDFGYWMAGGGMQKHRENVVRDEVMQRALLQELNLVSMDEVPQESKDPEWNLKESCLRGAEVRELDETQLGLTSAYVRLDRIGKAEIAKLSRGEEANPYHDWANV